MQQLYLYPYNSYSQGLPWCKETGQTETNQTEQCCREKMNENKPKKHFPDSLDQRKQTADLLPTLCPTALSPKPWANITNYSLVQTLLINGARRPGLRELTKQTWHGVLLYISVPSVSLWGCEHLVVWVGSMAHCGLLSSTERQNVKRSPWLVSDKLLHEEKESRIHFSLALVTRTSGKNDIQFAFLYIKPLI